MKTILHSRFPIFPAALIAALASGFATAKTVKLMDYFYPTQEGASWSYQETGWGGYAETERITMANTDWSLNLFTGKKSPKTYRKDVLRFKFERDFDGGGGDTWYEYFGKGSSFTPYGMDDDGEHERVDGGLVFPPSVSVGKTYSPDADFYYNGRFQGTITYSLRVIDTLPVTVKAGTFPDCVHLLFTFKQGRKVFQTNEEWWAMGLGVLRKKDVNEDGETRVQELVSSTLKTGPEVSIQQPKGSNLADATAKKSFGTVATGKTSPAKTFTITNTGTTKLTGLAIRKDGANAGDFIITAPAKSTLPPGTSTTFKVSFKPAAEGPRTAMLHVSSNDSDENPFDIALTGQGVK
jgi:hypothetical protein